MLRQVFWDWNGTLLDDLQYAIDVRNRVFPQFGLPEIRSLDAYYKQFTFPVREYYRNAGVTDEIFDDVAHAWIAEYLRGYASVPLHRDACDVLQRFSNAGIRQIMLSATKKDQLLEQIASHPIVHYFTDVLGLGDIYAFSKEAIGCAYLESCGIPGKESLMIGDSLHDAEVSSAMGTECILVCRGHQNRETLETAGVPVVDTLTEAADLCLNNRL